MDPSSSETPSLGLPPPALQEGSLNADVPQSGHIDMPPILAPPIQSGPFLAPAVAPTGAAAGPTPVAPNPLATTSAVAVADENSDALDEEWVSKAKAIVEKTKNDPYLESRELGKIKADYLRIRYNKQVKVAEDPTQ
jgi:hypothetical protein